MMRPTFFNYVFFLIFLTDHFVIGAHLTFDGEW